MALTMNELSGLGNGPEGVLVATTVTGRMTAQQHLDLARRRLLSLFGSSQPTAWRVGPGGTRVPIPSLESAAAAQARAQARARWQARDVLIRRKLAQRAAAAERRRVRHELETLERARARAVQRAEDMAWLAEVRRQPGGLRRWTDRFIAERRAARHARDLRLHRAEIASRPRDDDFPGTAPRRRPAPPTPAPRPVSLVIPRSPIHNLVEMVHAANVTQPRQAPLATPVRSGTVSVTSGAPHRPTGRVWTSEH
jgi:hypothetical protein